MGSQPAHGALDVFDICRHRHLAGKSIIDRNADISLRRELQRRTKEIVFAFVAAAPAASVNEHDRRPRLLTPLLKHRQIEFPGFIALAVSDVGNEFHALGDPLFDGLERRGRPWFLWPLLSLLSRTSVPGRSPTRTATEQTLRQGVQFATIEKTVFVRVVSFEIGLELAFGFVLGDLPVTVLVHRQPASHDCRTNSGASGLRFRRVCGTQSDSHNYHCKR